MNKNIPRTIYSIDIAEKSKIKRVGAYTPPRSFFSFLNIKNELQHEKCWLKIEITQY
jgi:hypothetical protein